MKPHNRWAEVKLKYLCRILGGGTPSTENRGFWDGDIPWVSAKDMGNFYVSDAEDHITTEAVTASATQIVPKGSVLVVVRSGILRHTIPVSVTTRDVAINQDMKALIPYGKIVPEYLAFFIIANQDRLLGQWRREGTTVESIEMGRLANCLCPTPHPHEQHGIVQFLTRETPKIDDLIAKKQRLIDLLEEKRAACVTRAVTRGPDSAVPMKDSGVIWLGQVPQHWAEHRLSELAAFTSGSTPSIERQDFWDGDIPWVSAKDMKTDFISDTADHVSTLALHEWGMSLIQPPAVLLVVRGMILAHSLPVAVSQVALTINQDMKALQVRPGCSTEFLMRWFQGVKHGVAALIEPSAHGTRCLRSDLLKRVRCFLPERGEQDQICRYIASETAKLQDVARATGAVIETLREYRAALITAAVTGQLDLRKHEKQIEALA